MDNEFFMRKLIAYAKEHHACYAAMVVQNNSIISLSVNSTESDKNPLAHAEIKAIMQAAQKIKSKDLSTCTSYTTVEPCAMCFFASFWAKINTIIYGASLADTKKYGERLIIPTERLTKMIQPSQLLMSQECRHDCLSLFDEWR